MFWLNKSSRPETSQRLQNISEWLATGAGQYLLESEKRIINQELNYIFGYHAVELSVSSEFQLLADSQVSRNFRFSTSPENRQTSQLALDCFQWPVKPASLDLVLLHHLIETSDRPHRLLSEAGNTIIPGGKMIVVGFNPWSLYQLTRLFSSKARRRFQGIHCISSRRMKDWLTLLGFRVEKIHQSAYLFPLNRLMKKKRSDLLEKQCSRWFLPFGSFYIIVATRETPGMTPIKSSWKGMNQPLVHQPIAGSSRVRENH
ncbi:hypothetical protein EOPP23_14345 [Endozoicomonas sp. OPT23]|nr:hypothetical protein [Endozoicomonas sp. OPT23]